MAEPATIDRVDRSFEQTGNALQGQGSQYSSERAEFDQLLADYKAMYKELQREQFEEAKLKSFEKKLKEIWQAIQ